jgi:phosphohistidine phosphatase
MKLLGLLRHAKSEWNDTDVRDFDRTLNERGRRGAKLMGDHVRDHGVKWERLIASPAARVKQTLEATGLKLDPHWEERAYLASSATLIDVIKAEGGDAQTVLLAGHNPGLHELVFDLVSPDEENDLFDEAARKFPTASFAVLELAIDDWADLADNCGKLIHLARPRDLDPELGPEN